MVQRSFRGGSAIFETPAMNVAPRSVSTPIEAPFEPEAGAYGDHAHGSTTYHQHAGGTGHGARIHEYGRHADGNDHHHDQ